MMVLYRWGVALCALGMLSNLPTALTIDAYGPICDNAGGIAEVTYGTSNPANVQLCLYLIHVNMRIRSF